MIFLKNSLHLTFYINQFIFYQEVLLRYGFESVLCWNRLTQLACDNIFPAADTILGRCCFEISHSWNIYTTENGRGYNLWLFLLWPSWLVNISKTVNHCLCRKWEASMQVTGASGEGNDGVGMEKQPKRSLWIRRAPGQMCLAARWHSC